MKKLFIFLLFILLIYFAKPLWEEPVSAYVDLSVLASVDEKVEAFLESESLESAVKYISDSADKAVLFLSTKIAGEKKAVEVAPKPDLEKPHQSILSIHNIELGASEEFVREELGNPNRQSINEYGTNWYTYHKGYSNFMMISFDDNRNVNAIYTNDDLISSDNGIKYGTEKPFVREVLGEPIEEIRKGLNIYILQQNDGFDVYKFDDMFAYIFYDLEQNETVTAVQLISTTLEQQKTGIYAGKNRDLQKGFELQLFDLTNASRVRHGFSILKWDDTVSKTAQKHSTDMAEQDYFSHENKLGKSPFDRMQDDNISFRSAGENLAYGQSSSIFAHEGLMNSPGHRENILLDTYSHLGVGVDFNEKSQPYYTENFLLK